MTPEDFTDKLWQLVEQSIPPEDDDAFADAKAVVIANLIVVLAALTASPDENRRYMAMGIITAQLFQRWDEIAADLSDDDNDDEGADEAPPNLTADDKAELSNMIERHREIITGEQQ